MNHKLALAMAGISIGAAGGAMIHAQQTKTPPRAYLIAEVDVTDPAAFQKYAGKVAETTAPFEGHYHYVVRTGTAEALEGEPPKRIVVIAFDSAEQALLWYRSPAYQSIIPNPAGRLREPPLSGGRIATSLSGVVRGQAWSPPTEIHSGRRDACLYTKK